MKKYKRILAFLLGILGTCCIIAAGIIFLQKQIADTAHRKLMETLRSQTPTVSAPETPVPPEGNENPESSGDSENGVSSANSEDPENGSNPGSSESSENGANPGSSEGSEDDAKPGSNANPEDSGDSENIPSQPEPVENPYLASFLANEDMAGWLQIPDTEIDYPIMWTPEDENYYLYRGFDKKENQNGCLILDTDSCLEPLTTNLIIHGHNMKSGAMFGNLTEYENPEYFEAHRQIILYTPQCRRNYEVLAVFRSQVYKKTDTQFKFYKFFQADTQEEFDDFYSNIKELSLYDTGVTASFGDHFITLSTCAYHTDHGRFVVVARETDCGETYLPVNK